MDALQKEFRWQRFKDVVATFQVVHVVILLPSNVTVQSCKKGQSNRDRGELCGEWWLMTQMVPSLDTWRSRMPRWAFPGNWVGRNGRIVSSTQSPNLTVESGEVIYLLREDTKRSWNATNWLGRTKRSDPLRSNISAKTHLKAPMDFLVNKDKGIFKEEVLMNGFICDLLLFGFFAFFL